jgi:hypothetical protein
MGLLVSNSGLNDLEPYCIPFILVKVVRFYSALVLMQN